MTDVFNHINIGFFSRDIKAEKYIRFTENCAKIYGYTTYDFLQNTLLWFEVIHPDDKILAEREFEVLEKGENSEATYRIFHKLGHIRWIEVKALPIFKNKKIVRIDGIVSDVTDRKNAEEKMLKAQQLSEIVLKTMPGMFYVFDSQGRYKYWNKQFSDITGYSDEEIKNLNPTEFILESERSSLSAKIVNVFASGEDELEGLLVTKDGRKIPFFFTGRRVVVDDEICLAGLGIDITERKKSEELLLKNEQMLSHILNSIPQSIFWKDRESKFMGCNSVFAKNLGLQNTVDVVGKTDYDFPCLPEEAKKYQEDDKAVMDSKKPRIHYIESLRTASGDNLWIDTTKIPLEGKNNEVYGVLGIFDDITERMREQERQRQITEELVQKNIGLREFSYIISHNLRAPISKILGSASLIDIQQEADPLNKELVDYIVKEVNNLDCVVKDLNSILAVQNTDRKVFSNTSFEEILKCASSDFANEINEINAKIISNFQQVSLIDTVPAYLHSVLNNLISNAIKFRSNKRNLQINIWSELKDDSICLVVKDNGQGIDLERYGHKLFILYNRFHLQDSGGKGVGLSLVKTQIEALGGKIELESAPDQGCAFRIYFPR